jgi:hypothetical protein
MPMFMSSAVMYFPPRLSMKRPIAWKRSADFAVRGSPITTDLPPPSPVSATADLYVIPRERRSTSKSASSSEG